MHGSGKVTKHKLKETERGNRGSKSILTRKIVKEQRVDGNYFNKYTKILKLRCTLYNFERNSYIKVPSKQINKIFYSTATCKYIITPNLVKLNPWFITGFADAKSCFTLSIKSDLNSKLKWKITPVFFIQLHIKDISILYEIKKKLGVGKIRKKGNNTIQYVVETIKDLLIIVSSF